MAILILSLKVETVLVLEEEVEEEEEDWSTLSESIAVRSVRAVLARSVKVEAV